MAEHRHELLLLKRRSGWTRAHMQMNVSVSLAALAFGDTRASDTQTEGGRDDPPRILTSVPEMRLRKRAQLSLRAVRSLRPARTHAVEAAAALRTAPIRTSLSEEFLAAA